MKYDIEELIKIALSVSAVGILILEFSIVTGYFWQMSWYIMGGN